MPSLPTAWAGFALAVLASAVLTALWIALARRRHWLDLPGARRLHGTPTPRGGGIGIALVMAGALTLGASPWLAAGVGLFALAGLVDDLVPLHAGVKLVLQLIAGALLALSLPAPWLVTAVLAVVAAYTVNVFNFMDGSN